MRTRQVDSRMKESYRDHDSTIYCDCHLHKQVAVGLALIAIGLMGMIGAIVWVME